tara:strand:- start:74 stop:226 length:153 start_codon:yes stop_codon:yes gene_type:complete
MNHYKVTGFNKGNGAVENVRARNQKEARAKFEAMHPGHKGGQAQNKGIVR